MKQNVIHVCDTQQLRKLFRKKLPHIFTLAVNNQALEGFTGELGSYVTTHRNRSCPAAGNILSLIENNKKTVFELSTEKHLEIQSITLLWEMLRGGEDRSVSPDLFLDLFYQFMLLEKPRVKKPSVKKNRSWMKRWPTGQDPGVIEIRARNKDRIIKLLISRIEHHHQPQSRFLFPPGISYEEKYNLVSEWWNDYKFQLAMAVKSPTELNRLLDHSLSKETMELLHEAKRKGIPFFATPYYLSLLNTTQRGYNDLSIRSYVIYSPELVKTFGEIVAWEKEDSVKPNEPNAAGWLLPNSHNIHRRYPEVAILIPDSMGRACGGLCASCQRMYDFQSKRFNFDLEALKPKETWGRKLRSLINYFEEDTQLRDILITGGDALMSQNKTLKNILDAVYKMAARKRKANLSRADGKKYAEIQRVRLGTRLPAYLPMRITPDLVDILREFKEKASAIGIKQFILQTHFQTPLEVTPEAKAAISKILASGWIITNQLVFTVASSRRGHTAQLRRTLNRLGVICYYSFSVKGFMENYAVFAPNSRSLQESLEEKELGRLMPIPEQNLSAILSGGKQIRDKIRVFLNDNRLPFLATDRNVLNLPGIGKSMTFRIAGITKEGKRILRFEHDSNRRHSPVTEKMGSIYIVENKSVGAYLRQLEMLGENPKDYESIWNYGNGQTEPRFLFFGYPRFDFNLSQELSHFRSTDVPV